MTETVVGRSTLGPIADLLGAGGQAKVYRVTGLTLADVPGPLVYKEYREGHAPPHGLHTLVNRRLRLDAATRARLDGLTAWPVRVVEQDGNVAGVLMRLIPESFFHQRVLPSGTTSSTLCEIQHLFVEPRRTARLGMPTPSTAERMLIIRDFASAVHLLHRHNLVIGDLNSKNAVFRLEARPAIMLVDCDAIRIKGSVAVVRQLNAPDWEPPEGSSLSQATDLYKLGLFVLRCLSPGDQASVSRDPRRADSLLDDEGRRLLRAALGAAPGARPVARDWGRHFDRILEAAYGTPRRAAAIAPPRSGTNATTTGWRRDPTTGSWVPAG
ncbi:hypothetical protein OHS58_33495 [Amycolatopsis sp. NBC_00348]|uniref:hypothetical protein n=1 Tax=Amycolatopsis sp. NBC_00348 TaxID=2975956 RepID=UPI002E261082